MTVRIAYGATGSPAVAKTIDFPYMAYRMTPPDYPRLTLGGKSAAGIKETLTVRTDASIDLAFRNLLRRDATHITLKRNLKQWEQWAQNGSAWTLALDSTNTVNTTITNSPAADASVITVASAAGIVAGREYVLRNEFDLEVVKVSGIAGLDLTLAEPLNFAFFSGDRFRAEMYWPARLVDNRPIIIERGPLFYDVELRFMEDLNSL